MAGNGPAPKDPNRRARRNKDAILQTVLRFEHAEAPELPKLRIERDGELAGWARNILDAVDGSTWVEVSASGDGLHVWGYGDLPHGRRITVGGSSAELYGIGRYVAVTGQTFNDMPRRLTDIQHVIDQLI